MKNTTLMAFGLYLVLAGPAALTEDGGGSKAASADGAGVQADSPSGAGASVASGLAGGETEAASTANAVGKINKEVQEGNVNIEVETDTGAPGL